MEQVSWLRESNNAPGETHGDRQTEERIHADWSKERIPCRRPCRVVDGECYLMYAEIDQDQRLRLYWRNSSRRVCESCGEEVVTLDIKWRLFGLCPSCYEKSAAHDVQDFVTGGDWRRPAASGIKIEVQPQEIGLKHTNRGLT